ncbi:MAG: nucleotidyltransferase domain-containing protein [Candidatus Omnitrophota bacterium]
MKKNSRKNSKSDIFNATNSLKILSYLADKPGKEFMGTEIANAAGISRCGVYLALKELKKQKLVSVTKRGKFFLYLIIYDDSAIRQFKVLKNVLALRPVISKLKSFSRKIILYGSYARGDNDLSSDIDLFIVAKDPEGVKEAVSSIKIKQKIQAVIKTSSELAELKDSEKVFMHEVDLGIVLWEEKT